MLSFSQHYTFFFPQNSQNTLTCKTSNIHLSQYKYIPTPAEANSFNIYLRRQIWKIYNAQIVGLSDKKVLESNESCNTYIKDRKRKKKAYQKKTHKSTITEDDHRNKKLEFLLQVNISPLPSAWNKKSDSLLSTMERTALHVELQW